MGRLGIGGLAQAGSPWPRVGLLYLSGLLAAAQLGRLSALAPLIAADLQLGLPTVALAISLLELGGAALGAWAGWLAQRLGLRGTLRWALLLLTLGGLGGASAQGATGLLGWRLVEAAGYLAVIVSAPVLIAQHGARHGPRLQAQALTLWSTFVPVGLALGAWASGMLAAAWGWRVAGLAGACLAALLTAVMWRLPLEEGGATAARAAPAPPAAGAPGGEATFRAGGPGPRLGLGAWCLALAFGGFALFEVGVFGLLPTLLVQQAGLSAAVAGRWTGVASLAAVLGCALALLLLRRGTPLRAPLLLSLGLPALMLPGVFTAPADPAWALGLATALSVLGGVFASLAFALLPVLAPGPGAMVRLNGLLAQCGASGSLLGPPLMAACVQAGGWPAAAGLGLGVTALALPLAWQALRAPRTPPAGP